MPIHTSLSNDLEDHFKALGVGSVAAYRLWCYRQGISTALDKTPDQLQAEIDLLYNEVEQVDPEANKNHDPRRAEWIARIFKGDMQEEKLSEVLHRVRVLYNNLSDDKSAQQALGCLILQVEKYSDLMHPVRATGNFGDTITNTYFGGLEQLARNYKDWMRPVEDWRCAFRHPRKQFHSLACHLLAKYEVPIFFNTVFFQGTTPRAQCEQGWYKHVANGQNIRTAGVPMRITKRMAHLFMQDTHKAKPLTQVFRYAQYASYGANRKSAWEFAHGPLSETFENEAFWETVVQFLAQQGFLDPTYINAIIDYVRNQKFSPQRVPQADGSVVEGPPVHPNFCMKGRSINKLIREVDLWHQQLTGMEDVALETWVPSGIGEFEHIELDTELGRNIQWSIHELVTSQQLYAEGRIMHHCAGSYVKRCASGERSVWSLRALDLDAAEENQYQEHVLTIEVDTKKKAVVQNTGKYNLKPFGKKHLASERKTGNVYLLLLRRAPTLMRMWMDKENLARG